jgi:hypothetical protein
MAKSFKLLRDKMSPESQARAEEKAQKMLAQMPMQELQRARFLSQDNIAETLHLKPASLSKMEQRTDLYISTLRSYIEAMGGQLDIIARFPHGEIKINNFKTLDIKKERNPVSA